MEFSIFIRMFYIFKWFLQEMLSYSLGMGYDFHWGFKPVLS